jgi:hypothetical protein
MRPLRDRALREWLGGHPLRAYARVWEHFDLRSACLPHSGSRAFSTHRDGSGERGEAIASVRPGS